MITTAFFGFIAYIIFRLYEDSKERDYSVKNRFVERKSYGQSRENSSWQDQKKTITNNPWDISDRDRWKKPDAEKNLIGDRWTVDFLKCLEWKRYEEVCMEYLRIKNCNAFVTCTGADGGIDIKIRNNKDTIFAVGQCKSWKRQIGVNLIRELYGVMAAENAKIGIFLTTSSYSLEAQAFARNKSLMLIDAEELVKLINGLDEASRKRIDKIATQGDYTTPTCVQCNEKMVKRIAKNGSNKGGEFWGCINYPKCSITMKVR
jgi:restriction system protein